MIRISQIDDDLSIYKNNVVVLLGIGVGTKQLIDLMRYHKINIAYICDGGKNTTIEGIKVINPAKLKEMAQNRDKFKNSTDIVVQISARNIAKGTSEAIRSIAIDKIIHFDEAWNVLNYFIKYNFFQQNSHLIEKLKEVLSSKREVEEVPKFLDYVYHNLNLKEFIFICSIPKTGDITLKKTFDFNSIKYYFTHHTVQCFDKTLLNNLSQKIKIIVGIREPISQYISLLYQDLEKPDNIFSTFMLESNKSNPFQNGGDAQEFFNIRFGDISKPTQTETYMTRMQEYILDLSEYPFDVTKGYSIARKENVEVLVYQLEKMNDIVKEISDWVDQKPFDKWVMGNEANGKWIADSYKQAQREITFSQEFFDKCYDDPWIQHFYSQEDIEKFKERWRSHIKD